MANLHYKTNIIMIFYVGANVKVKTKAIYSFESDFLIGP